MLAELPTLPIGSIGRAFGIEVDSGLPQHIDQNLQGVQSP
jgi:hypothetical protein